MPTVYIETGMGQSHLPVITNKYDLKYKKYRFDLVDEPKHQPFTRFIRNDLAVKLAKALRTNKILNMVIKALNILLATKMIISLDRYVFLPQMNGYIYIYIYIYKIF